VTTVSGRTICRSIDAISCAARPRSKRASPAPRSSANPIPIPRCGPTTAACRAFEEPAPIATDRELTWVLPDWRLTNDAQHRVDFGSMFDLSHAGRIGNTVTINGVVPDRPAG
jgi:hypothetical protein